MLERWLYAHRELPGRVSGVDRTFAESAVTILGDRLGAGPAIGRDAVAIDAAVASDQVPVIVEIMTMEPVDHGWRRPLRWHPAAPDQPFSTFEGYLELGGDPVELRMFGRIGVPDGSSRPALLLAAGETLVQQVLETVARGLSPSPSPPPPEGSRHGAASAVGDVMTPAPFVFYEDTPVQTAARVLQRRGVSGAPVLDGDGHVVGVLSVTDLLARAASPRNHQGLVQREQTRRRLARTAGEACSRPAITVRAATPLREAARELLDRDVHRLVVVDEERRVTGVVTRRDILPVLGRTDAELRQAVQEGLAACGAPDVTVEVHSPGLVSLRGPVSDPRTTVRAIQAARAVDGVTQIESHLTVSHPDV